MFFRSILTVLQGWTWPLSQAFKPESHPSLCTSLIKSYLMMKINSEDEHRLYKTKL